MDRRETARTSLSRRMSQRPAGYSNVIATQNAGAPCPPASISPPPPQSPRRCSTPPGDPTGYSAHSLRAGRAPEAAASGVEERDIGRHTSHRSIPVLRGYIREGIVFVNNASARPGLLPSCVTDQPLWQRTRAGCAFVAPCDILGLAETPTLLAWIALCR
jgi:hypothetical protein